MRFFPLFLFIFTLIFLETTFVILPLTVMVIFVLGLEANSPIRFIWTFLAGLAVDLFSKGFFPGITILFLVILLVTYLYRNFLSKNILVTLVLLFIFQSAYLHLTGVFPNVFNLLGGLILFFPILIILRLYLSFEKQKHLEFDFFNK